MKPRAVLVERSATKLLAYWVPSTPKPVPVGAVIGPFNSKVWSKIHNYGQVAAEEAIEKARPSSRPSRHGSVFVCPTLDGCSTYSKWRGRPIYRVEVTGQTFVTDGAYFEAAVHAAQDVHSARRGLVKIREVIASHKQPGPYWPSARARDDAFADEKHYLRMIELKTERIHEAAASYWKGGKAASWMGSTPEMLVKGTVRVVGKA